MSDLNLRVSLTALDNATAPMRKAMGAAMGLSGGLAKAQAGLRELEKQHRNIGAMRQYANEQKRIKTEWALATEKVKQLSIAQAKANQIGGQSAAALRAQAKEMASAKSEAARLKSAFIQNAQASQAMRDKLIAANVPIKGMAEKEKELRGEIERTTAAMKRQQDAQARTAKMAATGAKLGAAGAVSLYAGRDMGRRAGGVLEAGGDFEQKMSKVQALTRLGKQDADMVALRNQARQLGADTMFNASQAAEGQGFFGMAGFNPKQIMAAMPGTLDMAKAGDMDIGRTADISSNILQAFRLPAEDMGRVADVLTMGFTTANTDLEKLGNTMTYVAPIAHEFGASIETATAITGLLGNAGIQGEKAGTALRAMFVRLASPPKAAAKAMQQLGVKTQDAQGNMRNIVEILGDVSKATENMGNGKRLGYISDIFGVEAASALASLMKDAGTGGITKYLDVINNSQGAAAKTAKVMADNWRGSMDEMSSAWDDVKIGFFDQNADSLRDLTDAATDVIRKLGDFMNENPMLAKALFWAVAGAIALTTAAGALLIPVGLLLAKGALLRFLLAKVAIGFNPIKLAVRAVIWAFKGFGGVIAGVAKIVGPGLLTALRMAGTAFMWVARGVMLLGRAGLAFVMTPLGAALAVLALGAYLVWKNWDKIKPVLMGAWAWIQATWPKITAYFSNMGATAWNWGADLIDGLVNGIKSKFGELKNVVAGMAESVKLWFTAPVKIQSPSRVFMEYGGFLSEGIALGIANKAPMVAAAAASMAALPGLVAAPAMAAPGLAAPSSQAAAAPNSYAITINAAPGQDPQAIARAVSAELDRRERSQQSRGLSGLRDR